MFTAYLCLFYYVCCYRLYLHLFHYFFNLLSSYSATQPQVCNKVGVQCSVNWQFIARHHALDTAVYMHVVCTYPWLNVFCSHNCCSSRRRCDRKNSQSSRSIFWRKFSAVCSRIVLRTTGYHICTTNTSDMGISLKSPRKYCFCNMNYVGSSYGAGLLAKLGCMLA